MTIELKTRQQELTNNLRELTGQTIKAISENMNDHEAMLKNAKHYKDIASTLEKLANVVTKVVKLEKELFVDPRSDQMEDNSTTREQIEILDATINYYEGHKQRIHDSLEYLKKKQEEEGDEDDPDYLIRQRNI